MAYTFINRLKHAWNVFMSRDPPEGNPYDVAQYSPYQNFDMGLGSSLRPDRPRLTKGNEQSIVTAIYNRIAMDCSTIEFNHAKLDENKRFLSMYKSGLNTCLTVEANKDQTAKAFIQDIVLSMFDEGAVAVVPVDTDVDPEEGTYDIYSMRTGKIVQWFPDHVKVHLYDDRIGLKKDVDLPKSQVAIIENPFYAIVNEQNSTMKRLVRKLNLLDVIDEQSGAGKLDLIIQLPYVIKTEARKQQAETRRKDIEMQLSGSKYGIAYTDGTERITQLNRSVDNNLMKQIEYLTEMLYSQLGITKSILEGTASDTEMLNYNSRTIEPILSAIADEFKRKFLTPTARSQMQSVVYFRDPFKLVPINQMADIADRFTRNEILSSNELRQIIGMKPVKNEKADELRNKNLNASEGQTFTTTSGKEIVEEAPKKPDEEAPKSSSSESSLSTEEIKQLVDRLIAQKE